MLDEYPIVIPEYQRDYAYGRKLEDVEGKREDFVRTLHAALSNGEFEKLAIIYGDITKDKEKVFFPVDGQQRLTTLFLLHWYLFLRSDTTDLNKERERLKKFSYASRETSKEFCRKLLEMEIDWDGKEELSSQIKDEFWFTAHMRRDPTVISMLSVIDSLHRSFECDSDALITGYASSLKSDISTCPIKFDFLDMKEALGTKEAIRDLYITMNARGETLSEFELFKAQLQKKKDAGVDVLNNYLGDRDDAQARIELIGKLNTDYADVFFRMLDGGKVYDKSADDTEESGTQLFDISMMNYFKEIFRFNYLTAVAEATGKKDSYGDFEKSKSWRVKKLIKVIESCGEEQYRTYETSVLKNLNKKIKIEEENTNPKKLLQIKKDKQKAEADRSNELKELNRCVKERMRESSVLAFDVLELLHEEYEETKKIDSLTIGMFGQDLFGDITAEKPNNYDTLQRMLIYAYLKDLKSYPKKGDPDFEYWKRFIGIISKVTDWRDAEAIVDAYNGLRRILDYWKENGLKAHKSIRKQIAELFVPGDGTVYLEGEELSVGNRADGQFREELLKAHLIENDPGWEKIIRDAEDYTKDFMNGEIGFLFKASEAGKTIDKALFEKSLRFIKDLYDKNGSLKLSDRSLLTRALLTYTKDGEEFILPMSKSAYHTKKLDEPCLSRYLSSKENRIENENYDVITNCLCTLIDKCGDGLRMGKWKTTDEALRETIEDYKTAYKLNKKYEWKKIVICNDLMYQEVSGEKFFGGFEPEFGKRDVPTGYIKAYCTPDRRTRGWEMHSLSLAVALLSSPGCRADITYETSALSGAIKTKNNFPSPCIEIKDGTECIYAAWMNKESAPGAREGFYKKAGRNRIFIGTDIDDAMKKLGY